MTVYGLRYCTVQYSIRKSKEKMKIYQDVQQVETLFLIKTRTYCTILTPPNSSSSPNTSLLRGVEKQSVGDETTAKHDRQPTMADTVQNKRHDSLQNRRQKIEDCCYLSIHL